MLNPGRAIITEGPHFRGYLPGGQANILAGFPVRSRPAPDITEHPLVQPPGKTIGEDVRMGTAEGPRLTLPGPLRHT